MSTIKTHTHTHTHIYIYKCSSLISNDYSYTLLCKKFINLNYCLARQTNFVENMIFQTLCSFNFRYIIRYMRVSYGSFILYFSYFALN